jgi:hypothetical protein
MRGAAKPPLHEITRCQSFPLAAPSAQTQMRGEIFLENSESSETVRCSAPAASMRATTAGSLSLEHQNDYLERAL